MKQRIRNCVGSRWKSAQCVFHFEEMCLEVGHYKSSVNDIIKILDTKELRKIVTNNINNFGKIRWCSMFLLTRIFRNSESFMTAWQNLSVVLNKLIVFVMMEIIVCTFWCRPYIDCTIHMLCRYKLTFNVFNKSVIKVKRSKISIRFVKSGIYGIGRVIFYQKTDCPKKCGSYEF